MYRLTFVFVLGACAKCEKCDEQAPLLKINDGWIKGVQRQTSELQKTYYAFRGIPYAEPPLGKSRFQPPIPVRPWKGTLDAIDEGHDCVQGFVPTMGSEDCLYLNVFTPKISNCTFPVMVYIHGGDFIAGGANYYSFGPDYFLEQNVVVVTFNYRLGIFGFLTTGDSAAPGNYGLKDQLLALKWIKANIGHFAGDPKKITIFGQSAGSVSVSYHLQSKMSQGLFQRAIMQSGTCLCPWGFSKVGASAANLLGNTLKIEYKNSTQKLVDALRNVDFETLNRASVKTEIRLLLGNITANMIYAPVQEPEHGQAFWTGKCYESLKRGSFNHTPTLIGFNSMEASYIAPNWPLRLIFSLYLMNHNRIVPKDLNINEKTRAKVMKKIKHKYWGHEPALTATKSTYQFLSDSLFLKPIRETVKMLSSTAPVYFYRFSYQGLLAGNVSRQIPGAQHCEELNYLWRRDRPTNATDLLVRNRMVKMWTNFATYGTPIPDENNGLFLNISWPKVRDSKTDLNYLEISDRLEMKTNPEAANMKFWDELYETYGIPPYDTY